MTIHQISVLSFFNSHGNDYAMAIDRDKDIMLFTDQHKAEEKFNELIDTYTKIYNMPNEPVFICYEAINCMVIYHDNTKTARTYITLDSKETLD